MLILPELQKLYGIGKFEMKANDIKIPEKTLFSISMPVRIYDINYGNHLAHDSLISILHEARVSFLKNNNLSEGNVFGSGLILSSLAVVYRNQAFHGDIIQIALSVDSISKTSFEIVYYVTKETDESSVEIARAKTKMTFFDYKTNKINKIPSKFLELIAK